MYLNLLIDLNSGSFCVRNGFHLRLILYCTRLILILSVDAKKGSWRKIHTYFYKLINHTHYSSDNELKQIMREYGAVSKTFKTCVIAKDLDEMLEILRVDFYKYPAGFFKFSTHLKKFMEKYLDANGRVTLEMVHNAYIITKK